MSVHEAHRTHRVGWLRAAVLGANLTHLERAASLAIDAGGLSAAARDALVTSHVQAHAAGYDLGLFFFGLNCLIVASLLRRGRLTPLAIHLGLALSGVVYLTGSVLVVLGPALSPGIVSAFSVAYVVPLLAEVAFCGWLLVRAGRRDAAVAST